MRYLLDKLGIKNDMHSKRQFKTTLECRFRTWNKGNTCTIIVTWNYMENVRRSRAEKKYPILTQKKHNQYHCLWNFEN